MLPVPGAPGMMSIGRRIADGRTCSLHEELYRILVSWKAATSSRGVPQCAGRMRVDAPPIVKGTRSAYTSRIHLPLLCTKLRQAMDRGEVRLPYGVV